MTAASGPHRVRRPFSAGEVRLPVGAVVDVTGWRNGYQLVDRGYLVAIEPGEAADIACPRCGATGDNPCVSRTGNPTARHATR